MRPGRDWFLLLPWLLSILDFGTSLQIPCFVSRDRTCDIVEFSSCDTEKRECVCIPRYVERKHQCLPKLDAYCRRPGYPCAGQDNTVCGQDFRCVCDRGFRRKGELCVPAPPQLSTPAPLSTSRAPPSPLVPQVLPDNWEMPSGGGGWDAAVASGPSSTQRPPPSGPAQMVLQQGQQPSPNYSIGQWQTAYKNPAQRPPVYSGRTNSLQGQGQGGQRNPDNARKLLLQALMQNAQFRNILLQQVLNPSQSGSLAGILPAGVKAEDLIELLAPKQSPLEATATSVASFNQLGPLNPPVTQPPKKTKVPLGKGCLDSGECGSAHAVCFSGTCLCAPTWVESGGRCLPGLGVGCSAEEPCMATHSECAESGVCECSSGYRVHHGRCFPGIGNECGVQVGSACLNIPNSVCSPNSICVCRDGYVEFQGACRPETHGLRPELGLPCANLDCRPIAHAYCNSSGICACLPAFVQRGGRCLTPNLAERECQGDRDCDSKDDNSRCESSTGTCVCARGYHDILGKCYPGLGSSCSVRLPCGLPNSLCSAETGRCQCQSSARREGDTCVLLTSETAFSHPHSDASGRPSLSPVDWECPNPGQPCANLPFSYCSPHSPSGHRCLCLAGYRLNGERNACVPNIDTGGRGGPSSSRPTKLLDAAPPKDMPSQTRPDSPRPPPGLNPGMNPHRLVLEETRCSEAGVACVGIPSSLCTPDGICICVPGHVRTPTGCKPIDHLHRSSMASTKSSVGKKPKCSHGLPCDSDRNALCNGAGECICKEGYVRVSDRCFPSLGARCGREDWCGAPNSECSAAGICVCKPPFRQLQGTCQFPAGGGAGGFGASGQGRVECWSVGGKCGSVAGAVCNSSFLCECINGLVRVGSACLPPPSAEEPFHSYHHRHGDDHCMEGFVFIHGHCLPGVLLGYRCHHSRQCEWLAEGAECDERKQCACKKGFIPFNATTCLSSKALGQSCLIDGECQGGAEKSECVEGKCRCSANFRPILGLCFAGLGQRCDPLSPEPYLKCGVRGASCHSGVCHCVRPPHKGHRGRCQDLPVYNA